MGRLDSTIGFLPGVFCSSAERAPDPSSTNMHNRKTFAASRTANPFRPKRNFHKPRTRYSMRLKKIAHPTANDCQSMQSLNGVQFFAVEDALEQARGVMAVLESRQRQDAHRIAVNHPMQRSVAFDFVGIEAAFGIDYRPTAVHKAVQPGEFLAGVHVP